MTVLSSSTIRMTVSSQTAVDGVRWSYSSSNALAPLDVHSEQFQSEHAHVWLTSAATCTRACFQHHSSKRYPERICMRSGLWANQPALQLNGVSIGTDLQLPPYHHLALPKQSIYIHVSTLATNCKTTSAAGSQAAFPHSCSVAIITGPSQRSIPIHAIDLLPRHHRWCRHGPAKIGPSSAEATAGLPSLPRFVRRAALHSPPHT